MTHDVELLDRWAELVVAFGANVQPGQVVAIGGEPGKEPYVRALAEQAYKRGAKYVDALYFDMHVKRARLEHAAEEDLSYVPPWYGQRLLELSRLKAARIGLTGPVDPGALAGVDPRRAGKDTLPFLKESAQVVNARTTNWTAAPTPSPGWAKLVFPGLDEDAAFAKLWEQIAHVMRLDEDDPVAAWRERMDVVVGAGDRMTERRFDALHFEGPGTDLNVGLLPSSRWQAARFHTVDGLEHMPNVPSEEVFTTPDPARVDGVVRSTKPLYLGGSIIEGLEVEFREGRAARIDADANADVLRAYTERDEGASRLGEVALVDRQGRIGPLNTVFYDTLIDENAASHIALGGAYKFCVGSDEDKARSNESAIHVDFMIGSDDVAVTGVTRDGERVPVLRGGGWQL